MTQTTTRGNWPGKPKTLSDMKIVDELWSPPDNQAVTRGKSRYKDLIDSLMKAKPGTKAVHCPSKSQAMGLVHAIVRYTKQVGTVDKLRPAVKKAGEAYKVWVVTKDAQEK
jgi:hypothetical protein